MKKLILILIAFLLPVSVFAATAVPWSINNLTDTFISPNNVNNVPKGINITGNVDVNNTVGTYKMSGTIVLTASSTSGLTLGGLLAGANLLATTTVDAGNSVFGYQAMQNATSSLHSTAFGYLALKGDATLEPQYDGDNTAFGWKAVTANTTGHRVVGIGYQAGAGNTTANDSVYIGYLSGKGGNSSDSTCVGFNTCMANTFTGLANSAFGANALSNIQTGIFNVAFGGGLFNLLTGSNNVALGVSALGNITSASGNSAFGNNAGAGLRNGGNNNIFIGFNTGTTSSITGSRNIIIGHDLGPVDPTASNTLNIGNLIFGTGLTSEGTSSPAGNIGIGTTTPSATLSVSSNASTGNAFVVATSTGKQIGGYDNDGHRFSSGPAPAISTCGTGSPAVVGDDNGGTITTGTAATSCTLTFAKAYRQSPYCTVTDNSATIPGSISTLNTTTLTIALGTGLTGGIIYYQCSYSQ